jgi:hypothetical protein
MRFRDEHVPGWSVAECWAFVSSVSHTSSVLLNTVIPY